MSDGSSTRWHAMTERPSPSSSWPTATDPPIGRRIRSPRRAQPPEIEPETTSDPLGRNRARGRCVHPVRAKLLLEPRPPSRSTPTRFEPPLPGSSAPPPAHRLRRSFVRSPVRSYPPPGWRYSVHCSACRPSRRSSRWPCASMAPPAARPWHRSNRRRAATPPAHGGRQAEAHQASRSLADRGRQGQGRHPHHRRQDRDGCVPACHPGCRHREVPGLPRVQRAERLEKPGPLRSRRHVRRSLGSAELSCHRFRVRRQQGRGVPGEGGSRRGSQGPKARLQDRAQPGEGCPRLPGRRLRRVRREGRARARVGEGRLQSHRWPIQHRRAQAR